MSGSSACVNVEGGVYKAGWGPAQRLACTPDLGPGCGLLGLLKGRWLRGGVLGILPLSPQGERRGNRLKGQRAPGGFLTILPSPEHCQEAPCDQMEVVWRRLTVVSVPGCCAFHVMTRQRCDVGFNTTLFYR